MRVTLKHTGFLIGLILVIISPIFYARQQSVYLILLLSGLLIAGICFLIILLTKSSKKSKILWFLILVSAVAIQILIEPSFNRLSFRLFLSQNEEVMDQINRILLPKEYEIQILNDSIYDKNQLSANDKKLLTDLILKVDSYYISKFENQVYYEIYGFLDFRIGITYMSTRSPKDNNLKHLKNNWYIQMTNN